MRITTISISLFLVLVGGAGADTVPDPEHKTLESFADANAACREWTDGCAVCLRHENGTFDCSLPGIACQPRGLTCRTDKMPDIAAPAK